LKLLDIDTEHLWALDLIVLERDYGIVMPSNGKIAKTSVFR